MDITNTFLNENSTIFDALKVINANEALIGLVVNKDNKLIGTVTDGDLRRAFLKGFKNNDFLKDIMKKNFKYINEGSTYSEALSIMEKYDLAQVPVVNDSFNVVDVFCKKKAGIRQNSPVIIMAGGLGKRLRPLTNSCPKPMLEVGGKPILERILETYIKAGFINFYFSVNYLKEQIFDYFGNGSKWGVSINYIIEEKPLGTAGSLGLLPSGLEGPLFIANGDVLSNFNPLNMLDFYYKNDAFSSLAVIKHEHVFQFGVVKILGLELEGFEEKPTFVNYINAGIYVVDHKILEYLPKGEFFDMPSLILKARNHGHKIVTFPIDEYWLDIGHPDSLKKANLDWLIK